MHRRAILAGFVITGALMLSGVALAQDRGYYGQGRGNSAFQQGYQRGYSDGLNHGRSDRARGARYDYRGGQYDRGSSNGRWGNADQFRNGYRDGYRAGYEAGYRTRNGRGTWGYPGSNYPGSSNPGSSYPGYPNRAPNGGGWGYPGQNRGYSQVAYNNGHSLGLQAGQEDRRGGHSFDLQRHGTYRDATNGYHSDYGNKEAYRQQFRQGYARGYQEGYGRR